MGALDGFKVLDFTTLLPGPYATMTLADLGAEVLKVSGRDKYDLVVNWPPVIEGAQVTGAQAWLGRNKKTIFLNLKKPAAVEAVKKLVMEYDIVVEQFRPGVMDKLGVGYEELRKVNPRLIYCAITGYGQSGPFAMKAGHDINYLSRSGIAWAAGRKAGGPGLYNFQIADVAGGSMNAVSSILAAIIYRERTGEGQFIDVSMQDSVIPFNSMDGASYFAGGPMPMRESGMLNGGGIYDFYETSDGRFMGVGSLEPKFFAALCVGLGHPEWKDGKILKTDTGMVKRLSARFLKQRHGTSGQQFSRTSMPVLNPSWIWRKSQRMNTWCSAACGRLLRFRSQAPLPHPVPSRVPIQMLIHPMSATVPVQAMPPMLLMDHPVQVKRAGSVSHKWGVP